MTKEHELAKERFGEFLEIIAKLRSPEGCPWDREQTQKSLRGDLLEECYEAIEAIDDEDPPHVREELGDVLLLITMLSQINFESGNFNIGEVIEEISAKLIRRHPHVFGDEKVHDADEVLKNWDRIKTDIEGRHKGESAIAGIPTSLPPLERSYKVQKKAAKKGFDWPDISGPMSKISEELQEIEDARKTGDKDELENEVGDLIFSVVNYSRHLGINPTLALNRSNAKFEKRFRHVEEKMSEDGIEMNPKVLETMDAYWEKAKNQLS